MDRSEHQPQTGHQGPRPPGSEADALQSALERMVFLEWRVEQLSTALDAERTDLLAQREALARGAAREAAAAARHADQEARLAEARREIAELAARLDRAEAERGVLERRLSGLGDGPAARISQLERALLQARQQVLIKDRALENAYQRLDALETMRDRFFHKLVEWQRLSRIDDEEVDLAEFIAEMRAEIVHLATENQRALRREDRVREALAGAGLDLDALLEGRAQPAAIQPALEAPPAAAPEAQATVTAPPAADPDDEAHLLEALALFGPDDELAAFALGDAEPEADLPEPAPEEASSAPVPPRPGLRWVGDPRLSTSFGDARALLATLPDPARRARALERLEALRTGEAAAARAAARALVDLAGPLAASALAAALHAAPAPELQAALLELLGRTGERRALPVAEGRLSHPHPAVRAAALEAALHLAGRDGEALAPLLSAGLADADGRVRRRALMACSAAPGFDATAALRRALEDPDPQSRRIACAGLAGHRDPDVEAALLRGLLDPEPGVRGAAAASLNGRFGRDLRSLAQAPELERRRVVSRLLAERFGEAAAPVTAAAR